MKKFERGPLDSGKGLLGELPTEASWFIFDLPSARGIVYSSGDFHFARSCAKLIPRFLLPRKFIIARLAGSPRKKLAMEIDLSPLITFIHSAAEKPHRKTWCISLCVFGQPARKADWQGQVDRANHQDYRIASSNWIGDLHVCARRSYHRETVN